MRRHRKEARHVGPAPDASAGLAAEDPGHLAALEPDGQLLGVRQLLGVTPGLPVDVAAGSQARSFCSASGRIGIVTSQALRNSTGPRYAQSLI